MASAGFSSAGVFHPQESLQQQLGCGSLCRPSPKEFHYLSQGHGKQNISTSGFSHFKPSEHVDPWKCKEWLADYDQLSRPVSSFCRPEIIDVQDAHTESVILSSGISEQCSQHGKILPPLQCRSSIPEVESLNRPIIPDLMGFKGCETEFSHEFHVYEVGGDYFQPSLVYPEAEVLLPKPVLDCFEDFPCCSTMRILPDSRVLFMGSEAEISDLLSMLSDLYQSRKSTSLSRRQMVVPYFRRSRNVGRSNVRSLSVHTQTITSSPETAKVKPSTSKKDIKRAAKERDMYRKNFFHTCESLLFVILRGNTGEIAFLSLKKSGPEVSHLLMQVSASIVGAALAVLFSVVWKVAFFRVPFCSTKLLNAGIGLGLVWLSAAVNSLRENITMFSRNSSRIGWADVEISRRVERSLNQISFRALTLMVMAMLRYA